MSVLEKEINRIVSNSNKELEIILFKKHNEIIKSIKDNFIYKNPRALWEGFKYKPLSVDYKEDYPYLKLPDLVSKEEILYIIIDDFNEKYHIVKGRIKCIMFLIEDSEGLGEYYIVSEDRKRIICENDHDELLYIDLNKNPIARSVL